MSGFSVDWLNLREDADRRARDKKLLHRARQWLHCCRSTTAEQTLVVDLGAGTGATLRALTAPGSQPLSWRLVEHDGALLEEARRRHGEHYRIEEYRTDLSVTAGLPLKGARLVTASALFDLVSAPFIDALVARLSALPASQPAALYAALTYNGTTCWMPVHPLDREVLAAFNRDQCRDKGFGPALGPTAATQLGKVLEQAGFSVSTAQSDWVLRPADSKMTIALIDGIALAVSKDKTLDAAMLEDWRNFRLRHVSVGTCRVGHYDTLALPHTETLPLPGTAKD